MVKKRQPKKGKGVPRETAEENCLADVKKALRRGFSKDHFNKFETTVSANGFFEASMQQQIAILARVLCDYYPQTQHEELIESLAASEHEKVRGIAVACVDYSFKNSAGKKLKWLKKTGSLPGTWPRELAQGYLHMMAIENGVNDILPKVKPWLNSRDEAVRRLVVEGFRIRGVMLAHIDELKTNPIALRPIFEAVLDDSSEYVRKACANSINDACGFHADLMVKWCEGWLKPSSSAERQWVINRGLRNLVSSGHQGALKLLGYLPAENFELVLQQSAPPLVELNQLLPFELSIKNRTNIPAMVQLLLKLDEPGKTGRRQSKYQLFKGRLKPLQEKHILKEIHFVDKNQQPRLPGEYTASIVLNGATTSSHSFTLKK